MLPTLPHSAFVLAFTAALAVPGQGPSTEGAPATNSAISAARDLYASGRYEDALSQLMVVGVRDMAAAGEADRYRALCFLALGRSAEAERAIEKLLTRQPLFTLSPDESPRLIELFRTVRKRILPAAVRHLYATARTHFDRREFSEASRNLRDMLTLLADEEMADRQEFDGDFVVLAESFLALAEAELEATGQTRVTPARVEPSPRTLTSPIAAPIYSAANSEVTPPVEIEQAMPAWRPGDASLAQREHRGVLRIVIDEQGLVEAATIEEPIAEGYDTLLLSSTSNWRFRPAVLDGRPVKYLRNIPVVLAPN